MALSVSGSHLALLVLVLLRSRLFWFAILVSRNKVILSCLPHWFRRTEHEEVECIESKSEAWMGGDGIYCVSGVATAKTCFDRVASFVQKRVFIISLSSLFPVRALRSLGPLLADVAVVSEFIVNFQRRASNSYPPAYPGCHGLRPQVLSRDTLNSVCSSPNDYG